MKVVQVHNSYKFYGGETVIFEVTCRILKKNGHKVSLLERSSKKLQVLSGKLRAFTESIYSIPARKELSFILESVKPDIIDLHNIYPFISPSVLVACRQFKVPVVMRCQNYKQICPISFHFRNGKICEKCTGGREYWCILKNCRNNIFESVSYALRTSAARKWRIFKNDVTYYIPPTEFVKNRLVEAGFSPNRISVVPNMVSLPDTGINVSPGEYVAYAGRISPEKGISTLLAAAKRSGLPLKIAGDYSLMPETVKAAPFNVRFVEELNRDQLAKFYQNARFSVVPSIWYEPFGLVIAEAMSCGLPVIASKIGGIPEIVEDGVTGFLVEPGDPEDLSSKMKLLWENPDLCRQMGQAGRKRAAIKYSEDAYYKNIMNVYRKAIMINNATPKF